MEEAFAMSDQEMQTDDVEETVEVDDLGIGDVTGNVVRPQDPDEGKVLTFSHALITVVVSTVSQPSECFPSEFILVCRPTYSYLLIPSIRLLPFRRRILENP